MGPLSRSLLCAPALVVCGAVSAPAVGAEPSATAPSCAEGPVREGATIIGTPCADRIVVPANVARVDAGPGDDVIVAAPGAAAVPCPPGTCLGVGSQTFEGGPGDDVVFGERGNDTLRGGLGNDRLYGGIGDDLLEGGPGDDLLAGGFGADSIDGQEGDDYVRGDGTIDRIYDSGGGNDTLSYASGVTPGFSPSIDTGVGNFHAGENGERGVYLDLSTSPPQFNGNNGAAGEGGGSDEVETGVFETIIGTPFSDYIVGGEGNEKIYGGGGADVIRGEDGDDQLFGGADGDFLDGGEGSNTIGGEAGADNCVNPSAATSCAGTAEAVTLRDPSKVSIGLMTPAGGASQIYVDGSSGANTITATYAAGTVSLTGANFDTAASAAAGCNVTVSSASCPIGALDSIVIAGLGGDDELTATGFPQDAGVVLLGGEGEDELTGGEGSEDLLVDGGGGAEDVLSALGRDDILVHEGGPDQLLGGGGNDLFLSVSICDGETIDGGEGRDNASWARLGNNEGVEARLDAQRVGRFGASGDPGCGGEQLDSLLGIDDLEGSEQPDLLVGDGAENQLLGHRGADEYFAGAGTDSILANSGDSDTTINCGADADTATIDIPSEKVSDPTPVECETVRQGKPEEFRTVTELPPPPLPPLPPVDRRPPRTKIGKRPVALVTTARAHARVVFRFASSERGSSFRCRLDAKPYRTCASPRVYLLGPGRHAVRIFAVDAAGNRDPSPALIRLRVRRR